MTAFVFLFRDNAHVTAVDVVNRSVGGSFVACGLIAWQLRRDSRIGPLMTLTGFVFLSEAVLSGVDSSLAYTLSQWSGNWWTPVFGALVLSFPSGRISSRIDWAIVGAFAFGAVVLQLVWLFFYPFPPGHENVFLISADPDLANVIDRIEATFNATVGLALALVAISRWLRAAPPLRRLLLPTLAGGVTALILVTQIYYDVITGEFIRSSQQITAVLLVSVPLAFLLGMLHQQLARAGMADLVVALQRAPGSRRLGEALAKALGDPSLVLAYWLPRLTPTSTPRAVPWSCPRRARAARRRSSTTTDATSRHWCTTPRWRTSPTCSRWCARPPTSPSSASACRPSSRRGWSSCGRHASASSRPAMPSAGAWSAICTTVPSSAWSPSRFSSAC
ncbi:MAG TPA: hypothetical protein VFY32_13145 [Solirubrobacteraceae bacterium]|nr:hypothetical protein [Solirubrobacteraceae bacterium]